MILKLVNLSLFKFYDKFIKILKIHVKYDLNQYLVIRKIYNITDNMWKYVWIWFWLIIKLLLLEVVF